MKNLIKVILYCLAVILVVMSFHLSADMSAKENTIVKIPWNIDRVDCLSISESEEINEKNIRIGIIDTGIDLNHEDLSENIHGGVNFLNSALPPDDDNGHGTLLAGIIAANQNDKGIIGIAPYAQLFSIKAFNKDGKGKVSDIIKAIDWAIKNKMQIINISSSLEKDNKDLHNEIKKAAKAGILIVAAATDNSDNAGYPAMYPEVISVGSVNKQNKIMFSLGILNNEIDIYAMSL